MKRCIAIVLVATVPACGDDEAPLGPAGSVACFTETLRVTPDLTAQCLPRQLPVDASGHVPCVVLEARNTAPCECTDGRSSVSHDGLVDVAREDPRAATEGWNCFCEIDQLSEGALDACRAPEPPAGVDMAGWCYVDHPELVAKCAATEVQQIRYPDPDVPVAGSTLFMVCCEG